MSTYECVWGCMRICALCPGGIGMPPGCGLCGVAGKLDLASAPTLTPQRGRTALGSRRRLRVPGKRPGKGPELAQRHPHPGLCSGAVWSPRGAPWSHCCSHRLALLVTVGLVTRVHSLGQARLRGRLEPPRNEPSQEHGVKGAAVGAHVCLSALSELVPVPPGPGPTWRLPCGARR